MEKAIETIKHKGHTINIYYDSDPMDPWGEFDSLLSVRSYKWRPIDKYSGFEGAKEVFEHFGENGVWTECSLGDQRDYVYLFISVDKLRKEYGNLPVKELKAKGKIALEGEAILYRQWAGGDVYGYQVAGPLCDDSVWGYYGSDHEKSGLLEAAKDFINCAVKQEEDAKQFEHNHCAI